MKSKFFKSLSILVLINFLIKPFWILGIDRVVQNQVGAESYGYYYSLFNFAFIFSIILDLGISSYNNRTISQNRKLLPSYLGNILLLKLGLSALYLLVVFTGGSIFGLDTRQIQILGLLAFNQILSSFIIYLRSNVAALQLFKTDSILSVLDRTLMIILCSILIWANWVAEDIDIIRYIYAQTIGYGIAALTTLIIVFRFSRNIITEFGGISYKVDTGIMMNILKQSYPYALLILMMSVYNKVDGFMIERLLGAEGAFQAGIYAAGYRLLDATNM
ncbi:MAG: oligosaccharide flippase family protein, partial [Bacteroidetes bacterium]|nr:oligosaccharide flippase family protein [Bacteroidota bacterium]